MTKVLFIDRPAGAGPFRTASQLSMVPLYVVQHCSDSPSPGSQCSSDQEESAVS